MCLCQVLISVFLMVDMLFSCHTEKMCTKLCSVSSIYLQFKEGIGERTNLYFTPNRFQLWFVVWTKSNWMPLYVKCSFDFHILLPKTHHQNTNDLYIHYMDKGNGTYPSLEEKKSLTNCGYKEIHVLKIFISTSVVTVLKWIKWLYPYVYWCLMMSFWLTVCI